VPALFVAVGPAEVGRIAGLKFSLSAIALMATIKTNAAPAKASTVFTVFHRPPT